ncbi:helix-turn-helix domain-containing protein [Citricoccus muralis]
MSEQRRRAAEDLKAQGHSLNEIAAALGVSRSSVWRALNRVD